MGHITDLVYHLREMADQVVIRDSGILAMMSQRCEKWGFWAAYRGAWAAKVWGDYRIREVGAVLRA